MFKHGVRNGKGIVFNPNERIEEFKVLYKGNFKDDLFDGYGERYYSTELCYKGHFKKHMKHGEGIIENKTDAVKVSKPKSLFKRATVHTIAKTEGWYYKGRLEGICRSFDDKGKALAPVIYNNNKVISTKQHWVEWIEKYILKQ